MTDVHAGDGGGGGRGVGGGGGAQVTEVKCLCTLPLIPLVHAAPCTNEATYKHTHTRTHMDSMSSMFAHTRKTEINRH